MESNDNNSNHPNYQPDLVNSHRPIATVQELLDSLTRNTVREDFKEVRPVLEELASRSQQLKEPHVDTLLQICESSSIQQMMRHGMVPLMVKVTRQLPEAVVDSRYVNFLDELLKMSIHDDEGVCDEVISMLFMVCCNSDTGITPRFIHIDNFSGLIDTLLSLPKVSVDISGSGIDLLLVTVCRFLLEYRLYDNNFKEEATDVEEDNEKGCSNYSHQQCQPRLSKILGNLSEIADKANNSSYLTAENIHNYIADLVGELPITEVKTIETCLSLLLKLCTDDVLVEQVAFSVIHKHVVHILKSVVHQENPSHSLIVRCFDLLHRLAVKTNEEAQGLEIMDIVYSVMSAYRDNALIQNTGQLCLLSVLHSQPDLLMYIGEQHDQIPLATFVLGNILMHGKCPQVLKTSYCLLYNILDSPDVQSALSARNFHIAIDANMRYHRLDTVVWTLSYKVLNLLCEGNVDMKSKLIHYGFLKSLLETLSAICHAVSNNNSHMIEAAVELVTTLYHEGGVTSSVSDSLTKQYSDLVQKLWLNGYKLGERFCYSCAQCIVQIRGSSDIQKSLSVADDESLIGLILDCMSFYGDDVNMQKVGIKLLQLLADCQIPRTVIVMVCKLLDKFSSVDNSEDSQLHSGLAAIQEDIVVLCYLLVIKSEKTALWLAESDLFLYLLKIYSNNNSGNVSKMYNRSVLIKLIGACIHALASYDNVQSMLLERSCGAGCVKGVSCLLSLGATIADTGMESALSQACKVKHEYIVTMLLEKFKIVNDVKTPLKIALALENDVIVGLLLRALNEDITVGGCLNCSDLGLNDLKAMWFQPLLEGFKVSCIFFFLVIGNGKFVILLFFHTMKFDKKEYILVLACNL